METNYIALAQRMNELQPLVDSAAQAKLVEDVAAALRAAHAEIERLKAELDKWRPLTNEEAQKAYACRNALMRWETEKKV